MLPLSIIKDVWFLPFSCPLNLPRALPNKIWQQISCLPGKQFILVFLIKVLYMLFFQLDTCWNIYFWKVDPLFSFSFTVRRHGGLLCAYPQLSFIFIFLALSLFRNPLGYQCYKNIQGWFMSQTDWSFCNPEICPSSYMPLFYKHWVKYSVT